MSVPSFDAVKNSSTFAGDLSALSLDTEYRSLKDDPVGSFYKPCLRNSTLYQRSAGYFRSTVFLVVGPTILEFARRGGKMHLICSPELDPGDVEQIAAGYAKRSDLLGDLLIHEFDVLLADTRTTHLARSLATLIAVGAMELRLAVRADGRGIYHEKLGIFSDGLDHSVSFKGSTNETWSGWHDHGNFESLEVFCNWRGGLEAERVRRHKGHFEKLWSGTDQHVDVLLFPPTAEAYFKRFAMKGLDAVEAQSVPIPVQRRAAMPHQDAAITGWRLQGCRGILQHATGSGKTFTAILAIRAHVAEGSPALILVPSRLLLEQWAGELRDEVPHAALLLAGGGHDKWRQGRRLKGMTDPDTELGPRLVLATMQTAASAEFIANVVPGHHLLLVADEVHQVGSPQNSNVMHVDAGLRLGLSATPIRYGDPEGTEKILSYFGPVVPPPITLSDAVASGRLVPYEYYPHPINLNAQEASNWKDITKAIRQELARQKSDAQGGRQASEKAKLLLIKRSRIAKNASAKVLLACRILSAEYEPGHSWLVYCEDGGQLTDVLIDLRQAGLPCAEYHSSMPGDRTATMARFRAFGGILVSIRCLDEGVDIPAVSHAIILASSQNPRQFIQRRGRVLRRSGDKQMAVIHDAIVVPVDSEAEPEQASLLKSELLRSVEFATHAMNRGATAELRAVAIEMGIDVDDLTLGDTSEDDDGQ